MTTHTFDRHGQIVALGDTVQVLAISPDPDLDEDDLEMFLDMVGAHCPVERIDRDGTAWVAVCWNGGEGSQVTLLGLMPTQMAKIAA